MKTLNFGEVTFRAKRWYFPHLRLIRICKDLRIPVSSDQFLGVCIPRNFTILCEKLQFYNFTFTITAFLLLVLPRVFLEDSSFLLFWKELIKPPNKLFVFFLLAWSFSFFSFVEWSGLGDLACWKENLKTGVHKELGSGPPRNSWLCTFAPSAHKSNHWGCWVWMKVLALSFSL